MNVCALSTLQKICGVPIPNTFTAKSDETKPVQQTARHCTSSWRNHSVPVFSLAARGWPRFSRDSQFLQIIRLPNTSGDSLALQAIALHGFGIFGSLNGGLAG